MPVKTSLVRSGALGLLVLVVATAGAGEPYLPEDDEVLQTLPTALLADRDGLAELRRRLSASPGDADLAADVASQYVTLGKRGGGPRYFGYARAALAPWWEDPAAPTEVLRVRAKLRETDHDYQAALVDLERVLERDPRDTQAWIETVNLRRVRGEYDLAWQASDRLSEFAAGVANIFCRAPLMAVTGRAEEAATLIDQAVPVTRKELPTVLPWLLTMQAEVARALGQNEAAERAYREGLASDPADAYLKRAYADYLLDRDRPGEALELVADDTLDNGCLLAAAIAALRSGDAERAIQFRRDLADRFRETRLRGDLPHGRYEARFALEVEDSPRRALELALANWERQKEMRDTRNVLEAALAAGEPAAAAPAIAFLKGAGTQDVALERLVEQLEAAP